MQLTKNTKYTYTNKTESTHSEMGPVWQNPIQITVRIVHLSVLMIVHNFSTQYNTEQFWWSPLLPPDNHYNSDVVYWRRRGGYAWSLPVTWQRCRSYCSIRHDENPMIHAKFHGSICYRTGVMVDRSSTMRE